MSRFSALLCIIPAAIMVATHTFFLANSRAVRDWNESFRLDLAVNYACDAAMQEVVATTEDLGADYAAWGRVKVQPQTALDEFCTVLLKNYGMSCSEQNMDMIRVENLPVFAVCTYDGVYVAKLETINESGARDLIFSPKIPYVYKDTVNDKTYCLNLKGENANCFDRPNYKIRRVDVPSDLSLEKQSAIVNDTISTEFMNALWEGRGHTSTHDFYLPSGLMKVNPANSIASTTIMAYVDNFSFITGAEIRAFGVGGTSISTNDFVCCYYVNGSPVYTYSERVPPSAVVVKTYESAVLAAEEGWYFDLNTL